MTKQVSNDALLPRKSRNGFKSLRDDLVDKFWTRFKMSLDAEIGSGAWSIFEPY